jgi:hypothetical protein
MRPRDLEATYAGGPAVRSSAAEDGRAAAARRAPLEGVEKGLPAPSPSRAGMGMLQPRPAAWLAELVTVLAARHLGR